MSAPTQYVVSSDLRPPTPGFGAPSALTQSDRDHLRSRACKFVRTMANYLGGFSFSDANISLIAELAGTSLLGSWGPWNELPPKHVAAYNYVYENLNQAGFCYDMPSGGTPPVPPGG